MGGRLERWRALDGRDRRRLLGCMAGLPLMHAGVAVFGYKRMRSAVERWSRHPAPRPANVEEIADAQALARLAAIAGRRGMVEATCLRRSLLLYGWLRRKGLRPQLQLGVPESTVPGAKFEAHAWVELEGIRLLDSDDGYRPFSRKSDR